MLIEVKPDEKTEKSLDLLKKTLKVLTFGVFILALTNILNYTKK